LIFVAQALLPVPDSQESTPDSKRSPGIGSTAGNKLLTTALAAGNQQLSCQGTISARRLSGFQLPNCQITKSVEVSKFIF
jgi:hypothetical protein